MTDPQPTLITFPVPGPRTLPNHAWAVVQGKRVLQVSERSFWTAREAHNAGAAYATMNRLAHEAAAHVEDARVAVAGAVAAVDAPRLGLV